MMRLNLKGFLATGALIVATISISGCAGSNAMTSSSGTTTNRFTGSSGSSSSSTTPIPPANSGNNGSAPLPPQGATTFSNIQNQKGWQTCGGCGNDGGGGQSPGYDINQQIFSPSLSGRSAGFWVTGGPAFNRWGDLI